MPSIANYRGIIPAISCPFTADHRIDEPALRKLASWLAGHDGVVAIMTNGHTGEVFSLTPSERAEVTRIVAVALDVMPPHHWLRFGFTPGHALQYFDAIHRAAPELDLVCHVYPAWTRASYSSQLLAELARLPYLQAFKVGQRDMNKYARDIQAIREADASKAILTCHDEYLLASMVQGVDGALVGFATFIPQLIIDLWNAVKAGDLKKAMAVQALITPLKDAVYGGGEPTGEAHARMKGGMYLAGVLDNATVRPPTEAPNAREMEALHAAVQQAGLSKR